MTRCTHLVGTIPAPDADAAMALAREHLGTTLRWLPDGETGARNNWILPIVESLKTNPSLEMVHDGDWSDYDHIPRLRVKRGRRLRGDDLDFGYLQHFRDNYAAFQRAKAELGDDDLAFQIGVPGDFDLTGTVLGPRGALVHRKAFADATLRDIRAIVAESAGDVVFQIEVPFELVTVAQAKGPLRPVAARVLAGGIAKLARRSPDGTRFGIHLCLGDMNHEALTNMPDMSPVVVLANAIAAAWPDGRPLEFVHAPFAGASQAPPAEPAYYAPLGRLRLARATRFVAGFVYEHQSEAEQRRLLELIESAYGGPVDLSTACGLGRRSLDEAVASMQRARVLAEA